MKIMKLPFRKEPDPHNLGPRPSKTGTPKNSDYLTVHPGAISNPDKAERMARTEMDFRDRIIRAGKMAEALSEKDDATRGYLLGLIHQPKVLPRDELGWTARKYFEDILRLRTEAPASIEGAGSSYDVCMGAARLVMAEIGNEQSIEAAEDYEKVLVEHAAERAGEVDPADLKRAVDDALSGGFHTVPAAKLVGESAVDLAA